MSDQRGVTPSAEDRGGSMDTFNDAKRIKLEDGTVLNVPSNFASPSPNFTAINSPSDMATPVIASPSNGAADNLNNSTTSTPAFVDSNPTTPQPVRASTPNATIQVPSKLSKSISTTQLNTQAAEKEITPAMDTTATAATTNTTTTTTTTTTTVTAKSEKQNPEDLTDAVAAAGVNIRAEEEAMVGGITISKKPADLNNFLKPHQLKWFMKKVMEENGLKNLDLDADVLTLVSSAAETYMSSILTDTLILSNHRRRPIQPKAKPSGGLNATKSDISKALKDIAAKQKDKEERRLKRRIALGIDTEDREKSGLTTEEHRARNATAAMMMSGSKKKKYSWMMSGESGSGSGKPNAVQARGDTGIRYREAREEPEIAIRDLLNAVENRRLGVSTVLVKGYSKLRD